MSMRVTDQQIADAWTAGCAFGMAKGRDVPFSVVEDGRDAYCRDAREASLHTWEGPRPEVARDAEGAPVRPCPGWDWPEE